MTGQFRRLFADERGSALVEYALAASLTSLAMLAGLNIIANALTTTINNLSYILNFNQTQGF